MSGRPLTGSYRYPDQPDRTGSSPLPRHPPNLASPLNWNPALYVCGTATKTVSYRRAQPLLILAGGPPGRRSAAFRSAFEKFDADLR